MTIKTSTGSSKTELSSRGKRPFKVRRSGANYGPCPSANFKHFDFCLMLEVSKLQASRIQNAWSSCLFITLVHSESSARSPTLRVAVESRNSSSRGQGAQRFLRTEPSVAKKSGKTNLTEIKTQTKTKPKTKRVKLPTGGASRPPRRFPRFCFRFRFRFRFNFR